MRSCRNTGGHKEPEDHGLMTHRLRAALSAINHAVGVVESRRLHYGDPAVCFLETARIASGALGRALSSDDVAAFMIAAKIARLRNTTDHRDSWIDIIGYAICGALVMSPGKPQREVYDDVVSTAKAALAHAGVDNNDAHAILNAIFEVLAECRRDVNAWAEIMALAASGVAMTDCI